MKRIPVAGPSITRKEIAYVADAVERCWYEHANEYHQRFEAAFARYVGTRYAVALPSCTSALHLALAALGIGAGDEVIVPELTWIATAAPISYVGATPVFADVDEQTWCLSADAVRACLTPRTRAVIAVDLYGNLPDYTSLQAVCEAAGVPLIEDAAEAFGSRWHSRAAGSLGLAGVFSFHGSKTITTGEGGMLVSNDASLVERVHVLRDHGRAVGDTRFLNAEVAYKYKMSSLQAALGLAQLERAEEIVAAKRQIFSWYREALRELTELTLNPEPPGVFNACWMTTCLVDPELGLDKHELGRALDAAAIDSRPLFHPLSSLPAYADCPTAAVARSRNRVAYQLSPRGLNLPSGLTLQRDDVTRVAGVLARCVEDARRATTSGATRPGRSSPPPPACRGAAGRPPVGPPGRVPWGASYAEGARPPGAARPAGPGFC